MYTLLCPLSFFYISLAIFHLVTELAYQPCQSFHTLFLTDQLYHTHHSFQRTNCIICIGPHTLLYSYIMRSSRMLSGASAILALFRGASALVARGQLPPTFSTSSFVGSATDYPDLKRDGGGGGTVNGINVVSQ